MRNLLKNKLFYIWSIIILLIGIAIGLPFSIHGIAICWKIELFDLISLFVTILLAIYVATSLERRVQDDRIEKELHIEQIGQIEDLLSEIEAILRTESIQYRNIISRVSKIRIKKNSIFNALQESLPKQDSLKDKTNSITQTIDTLRRLLTETSVDSSDDVVMKDGVLTYSTTRISDINNTICTLENELYRLKIILNRL